MSDEKKDDRQGGLFDYPMVRSTDPDTSRLAYYGTPEVERDNLRQRVLLLLASELGGLTTVEIADRLGKPRDSVSPRMRELILRDRAHDSGERRRSEHTTRSLIVWRLGPKPIAS